jgi:ribonuclease P protein component
MLARHFRFKGLGSVRAAMNHGLTTRAGLFTIKRLPRHNQPLPRAAVVVSRKAAKLAVTRNRIRRRIYEQLQAQWSLVTEPMDIVVIVHDKRLAKLPEVELKAIFSRNFKSSLAAPYSPPTYRPR